MRRLGHARRRARFPRDASALPPLLRHRRTVPVVREPQLAGAERQRRLVAAGIFATIALVLAQTAAQLLNYGLHLDLHALDSNRDGGVFGAVGAVAVFAACAAAWGALRRIPEARGPLQALAPLLTFLAVDKALRLHDQVAHWLVVYLPLLAGAFILLLEVARRTSLPAGRLIVAGVALLAVAFLIHQFGEDVLVRLHESPTGWLYQVKGATKHGAELAGWLLVGLGLMVGCVSAQVKAASSPSHPAHSRSA
jgi:hypothetical protein